MFLKTQNIFVFMITYFRFDKQPKHVIICIFEVPKVIGQTLINNLRSLFNQYELKKNHFLCQK
jgi:hypothetical protein